MEESFEGQDMTKTFCDICGAPGAQQQRIDCLYPLDMKGRDAALVERQTNIVTSTTFSYQFHPTGFGGPPDLCAGCVARLVQNLANAAASRALQAERSTT